MLDTGEFWSDAARRNCTASIVQNAGLSPEKDMLDTGEFWSEARRNCVASIIQNATRAWLIKRKIDVVLDNAAGYY